MMHPPNRRAKGPRDKFGTYPSFAAHACLAWLLAGLIVLHLRSAVHHYFVRKDGVLRRILFGKRVIVPTSPIAR
jgi:cytochrome b561